MNPFSPLTTAILVATLLATAALHAQDQAAPQPSPSPGARRTSPPQPQQQQGLDYFAGSWSFIWTGRESALTSGPRSGTTTFTRLGASNFVTIATTGKTDTGSAFTEAGVLGWSEPHKVVVLHERLGNGTEMLSIGDWSSPLSIRFDSSPVTVQSQTIRLRRVYSIISGQSFSVTEEIAIGDAPFQRLGNGEFTKAGTR